jgi:hypothetical protein
MSEKKSMAQFFFHPLLKTALSASPPPIDVTVSEVAGIEPRTVATVAILNS